MAKIENNDKEIAENGDNSESASDTEGLPDKLALLKQYKETIVHLCNYQNEYTTRVESLLESWNYIALILQQSTQEASENLLHWVLKYTVRLILVGDWIKIPQEKRDTIKNKIEEIIPKLQSGSMSLYRCEYILKNIENPWGDEELLNVLRGDPWIVTDSDMSFLTAERGCMILLRLQKLCETKCDDMAFAWSSKALKAYRSVDVEHPLIKSTSPRQYVFIFDVYLCYLHKYGHVSKIIDEVKLLDLESAQQFINRNVNPNAEVARLTKYRQRVARLAADIIIAKLMVEELSEQNEKYYCDILKEWLCFHKTVPVAEFRKIARKLYMTAISRKHLYLACEIIEKMEINEWRDLILELCVRGITGDLNELELMKSEKSCDEYIVIQHEIDLSYRYIYLADLLKNQSHLAQECILTAFSLNPTKENYQLVREIAVKNQRNPTTPEISPTKIAPCSGDVSASTMGALQEHMISKEVTLTKIVEKSRMTVTSAPLQPVEVNVKLPEIVEQTLAMNSVHPGVDGESSFPAITHLPQPVHSSDTAGVPFKSDNIAVGSTRSSETPSVVLPEKEVPQVNQFVQPKPSAAEIRAHRASIDVLHSITGSSKILESPSYDALAAPSLILDSIETMDLPDHIRMDLSVLLSSPRLKILSWMLPWQELDIHCQKLLKEDCKLSIVRQSLAVANDRLQYLNLDYNQFKHLPESECPGIEKGYEMYSLDSDDNLDLSDGNLSPDELAKKKKRRRKKKFKDGKEKAQKIPKQPKDKIPKQPRKYTKQNKKVGPKDSGTLSKMTTLTQQQQNQQQTSQKAREYEALIRALYYQQLQHQLQLSQSLAMLNQNTQINRNFFLPYLAAQLQERARMDRQAMPPPATVPVQKTPRKAEPAKKVIKKEQQPTETQSPSKPQTPKLQLQAQTLSPLQQQLQSPPKLQMSTQSQPPPLQLQAQIQQQLQSQPQLQPQLQQQLQAQSHLQTQLSSLSQPIQPAVKDNTLVKLAILQNLTQKMLLQQQQQQQLQQMQQQQQPSTSKAVQPQPPGLVLNPFAYHLQSNSGLTIKRTTTPTATITSAQKTTITAANVTLTPICASSTSVIAQKLSALSSATANLLSKAQILAAGNIPLNPPNMPIKKATTPKTQKTSAPKASSSKTTPAKSTVTKTTAAKATTSTAATGKVNTAKATMGKASSSKPALGVNIPKKTVATTKVIAIKAAAMDTKSSIPLIFPIPNAEPLSAPSNTFAGIFPKNEVVRREEQTSEPSLKPLQDEDSSTESAPESLNLTRSPDQCYEEEAISLDLGGEEVVTEAVKPINSNNTMPPITTTTNEETAINSVLFAALNSNVQQEVEVRTENTQSSNLHNISASKNPKNGEEISSQKSNVPVSTIPPESSSTLNASTSAEGNEQFPISVTQEIEQYIIKIREEGLVDDATIDPPISASQEKENNEIIDMLLDMEENNKLGRDGLKTDAHPPPRPPATLLTAVAGRKHDIIKRINPEQEQTALNHIPEVINPDQQVGSELTVHRKTSDISEIPPTPNKLPNDGDVEEASPSVDLGDKQSPLNDAKTLKKAQDNSTTELRTTEATSELLESKEAQGESKVLTKSQEIISQKTDEKITNFGIANWEEAGDGDLPDYISHESNSPIPPVLQDDYDAFDRIPEIPTNRFPSEADDRGDDGEPLEDPLKIRSEDPLKIRPEDLNRSLDLSSDRNSLSNMWRPVHTSSPMTRQGHTYPTTRSRDPRTYRRRVADPVIEEEKITVEHIRRPCSTLPLPDKKNRQQKEFTKKRQRRKTIDVAPEKLANEKLIENENLEKVDLKPKRVRKKPPAAKKSTTKTTENPEEGPDAPKAPNNNKPLQEKNEPKLSAKDKRQTKTDIKKGNKKAEKSTVTKTEQNQTPKGGENPFEKPPILETKRVSKANMRYIEDNAEPENIPRRSASRKRHPPKYVYNEDGSDVEIQTFFSRTKSSLSTRRRQSEFGSKKPRGRPPRTRQVASRSVMTRARTSLGIKRTQNYFEREFSPVCTRRASKIKSQLPNVLPTSNGFDSGEIHKQTPTSVPAKVPTRTPQTGHPGLIRRKSLLNVPNIPGLFDYAQLPYISRPGPPQQEEPMISDFEIFNPRRPRRNSRSLHRSLNESDLEVRSGYESSSSERRSRPQSRQSNYRRKDESDSSYRPSPVQTKRKSRRDTHRLRNPPNAEANKSSTVPNNTKRVATPAPNRSRYNSRRRNASESQDESDEEVKSWLHTFLPNIRARRRSRRRSCVKTNMAEYSDSQEDFDTRSPDILGTPKLARKALRSRRTSTVNVTYYDEDSDSDSDFVLKSKKKRSKSIELANAEYRLPGRTYEKKTKTPRTKRKQSKRQTHVFSVYSLELPEEIQYDPKLFVQEPTVVLTRFDEPAPSADDVIILNTSSSDSDVQLISEEYIARPRRIPGTARATPIPQPAKRVKKIYLKNIRSSKIAIVNESSCSSPRTEPEVNDATEAVKDAELGPPLEPARGMINKAVAGDKSADKNFSVGQDVGKSNLSRRSQVSCVSRISHKRQSTVPEKSESKKPESQKIELKRSEPQKAEPQNLKLKITEPQQPEPKKSEPQKSEPEKSESEKPESEKPESEKPESEKPESENPESEKPESEKPESEKPELEKPESEKSEPQKAEPQKSKPQKPEPSKREPHKPESQKADALKSKPNKPEVETPEPQKSKRQKSEPQKLIPEKEMDTSILPTGKLLEVHKTNENIEQTEESNTPEPPILEPPVLEPPKLHRKPMPQRRRLDSRKLSVIPQQRSESQPPHLKRAISQPPPDVAEPLAALDVSSAVNCLPEIRLNRLDNLTMLHYKQSILVNGILVANPTISLKRLKIDQLPVIVSDKENVKQQQKKKKRQKMPKRKYFPAHLQPVLREELNGWAFQANYNQQNFNVDLNSEAEVPGDQWNNLDMFQVSSDDESTSETEPRKLAKIPRIDNKLSKNCNVTNGLNKDGQPPRPATRLGCKKNFMFDIYSVVVKPEFVEPPNAFLNCKKNESMSKPSAETSDIFLAIAAKLIAKSLSISEEKQEYLDKMTRDRVNCWLPQVLTRRYLEQATTKILLGIRNVLQKTISSVSQPKNGCKVVNETLDERKNEFYLGKKLFNALATRPTEDKCAGDLKLPAYYELRKMIYRRALGEKLDNKIRPFDSLNNMKTNEHKDPLSDRLLYNVPGFHTLEYFTAPSFHCLPVVRIVHSTSPLGEKDDSPASSSEASGDATKNPGINQAPTNGQKATLVPIVHKPFCPPTSNHSEVSPANVRIIIPQTTTKKSLRPLNTSGAATNTTATLIKVDKREVSERISRLEPNIVLLGCNNSNKFVPIKKDILLATTTNPMEQDASRTTIQQCRLVESGALKSVPKITVTNEKFIVGAAASNTTLVPVQFIYKSEGGMIHLTPVSNSTSFQNISLTKDIKAISLVKADVKSVTTGQTDTSPLSIISTRSLYEENYAKFIQTSSNSTPQHQTTAVVRTIVQQNSHSSEASPVSASLPKFTQAFGKSVYVEGTNQNSTKPLTDTGAIIKKDQDKAAAPATGSFLLTKQNVTISRPILTSVAETLTKNKTSSTIPAARIVTGTRQQLKIIQTDSSGSSISINSTSNGQQTTLLSPIPISVPIVPQSAISNYVQTRFVRPLFHISQNNLSQAQAQQQILITAAHPPDITVSSSTNRSNPVSNTIVSSGSSNILTTTATAKIKCLPTLTVTRCERPLSTTVEKKSSNEQRHVDNSTLEQLREFDLVLEQVKERSTTTSANADNKVANVEKVGQGAISVINKTGVTLQKSTTITPILKADNAKKLDEEKTRVPLPHGSKINFALVQNSPVVVVANNLTQSKILTSTSKGLNVLEKTRAEIRTTQSTQTIQTALSTVSQTKFITTKPKITQKAAPTPPALPIQTTYPQKVSKPQEDEQTVQRIYDILAEYAEQLRNSPDLNNKPAPRRRSNPLNSCNSGGKKRKTFMQKPSDGSFGTNEIDQTMDSEDSSCGTSSLYNRSPMHDSSTSVDNSSHFDRRQQLIGTETEGVFAIVDTASKPSATKMTSRQQAVNVVSLDMNNSSHPSRTSTAVLVPGKYIFPLNTIKSVETGEEKKLIASAQQIVYKTKPVRMPDSLTHQKAAFKPITIQNVRQPIGFVQNEQISPRKSTGNMQKTAIVFQTQPSNFNTIQSQKNALKIIEMSAIKNIPPTLVPAQNTEAVLDLKQQPNRVQETSVITKTTPTIQSTKRDDSKRHNPFNNKNAHNTLLLSASPPSTTLTKMQTEATRKTTDKIKNNLRLDSCRGTSSRILTQLNEGRRLALEREMKFQKSLSDECEDLGVDEPSASDLFPEADLLFDPTSSSFENNSQDDIPADVEDKRLDVSITTREAKVTPPKTMPIPISNGGGSCSAIKSSLIVDNLRSACLREVIGWETSDSPPRKTPPNLVIQHTGNSSQSPFRRDSITPSPSNLLKMEKWSPTTSLESGGGVEAVENGGEVQNGRKRRISARGTIKKSQNCPCCTSVPTSTTTVLSSSTQTLTTLTCPKDRLNSCNKAGMMSNHPLYADIKRLRSIRVNTSTSITKPTQSHSTTPAYKMDKITSTVITGLSKDSTTMTTTTTTPPAVVSAVANTDNSLTRRMVITNRFSKTNRR